MSPIALACALDTHHVPRPAVGSAAVTEPPAKSFDWRRAAIVLGAVLRHVPIDSQPGTFVLAVKFHLFLAGVLTLHPVHWTARRLPEQNPCGFLAGQPLERCRALV